MMCINHFGGYLCLPHNSQIFVSNSEDQTDVTRPAVPRAGGGYQEHVGGGAGFARDYQEPGAVSCSPGFAADEQKVCRGRSGGRPVCSTAYG